MDESGQLVGNETETERKRKSVAQIDYNQEEIKRQKHVKTVAVLGEEDASVKLLEDLVFGAEDDLVERLAEVGNFNPTFPSSARLATAS